MSKKWQFQNIKLQHALQDARAAAHQSISVQPAITLPIRPETGIPLPPTRSVFWQEEKTNAELFITPAEGDAHRASPALTEEDSISEPSVEVPPVQSLTARKQTLLRGVALVLSILLALTLYFTWHATTPTSASPTVTPQTYSSIPSPQPGSSSNNSAATTSNSMIQVYIVGAIKHPGVYTLPADARIYQLIQAAGGTLAGANLVALNLAEKLSDGQEIYVLSIGETLPAGYPNGSPGPGSTTTPGVASGQAVNINTASENEMRQALHISATTAQNIIAYRTQNGPYTSVDQLLNVMSKTIYDRIKSLVTI